MKKGFLTLLFTMIGSLCFCQVKPLNDGNYNIAQDKLRHGEILLAYKNYLIFEYLNYERISLPVNHDAKAKLEARIKQLEDHLLQSGDIISIKIGRGWSDGKADSVIKSKKKELSTQGTSIIIN